MKKIALTVLALLLTNGVYAEDAVFPSTLNDAQDRLLNSETDRRIALEALYTFGRKSFPVLKRAMNSNDPQVQRLAMEGLANLIPALPGQISELTKYLDHADEQVRLQAMQGLIKAGGPGIEQLLARLDSSFKHQIEVSVALTNYFKTYGYNADRSLHFIKPNRNTADKTRRISTLFSAFTQKYADPYISQLQSIAMAQPAYDN